MSKIQQKQEAKDLLLEKLKWLRSSLKEVLEKFELKRSSQIAEMIRTLEGKDIIAETPRPPRTKDIKRMIAKIESLKIKPQKGRAKDLRRIQRYIKEFTQIFPVL